MDSIIQNISKPAAEEGSSPNLMVNRWGSRAWIAMWIVLSVLHVTQSIWSSRLDRVPGDALDGRFNNLVLEHGCQALLGTYPWLSPGQYHPETRTLGMSDTHAGTLPIYASFRLMGATTEGAFQGWFFAVAALNAWGAARVLRALRTPAALAGPLIFIGSASAATVWIAGSHMQLLPLFPALFALEQLVRFAADRYKPHLLAAAGWIGWQFAASPYLAFFAVVFGLVGAVALYITEKRATASVRSPDVASETSAPAWRAWVAAGSVALVGGLLCAAAVWAYVSMLSSGYGRPISELIEHAPHLSSWFSAPPIHLWYPPGEPGGSRNLVEQAWFSGFWPWIGLAGGLFVGLRNRSTWHGRAALTLALAALGGMLLFTAWGTDSAFTLLARKFEELRAFRASGRAGITLHLAQVLTAAAALAFFWNRHGANKPVRLALVSFTLIGAGEALTERQPSVEVASLQARRSGVVDAWHAAGDRPILLFAPGFSNQSEQLCHLDAWAAAMQLGRVTVNGYSGDVPASHVTFIHSPSEEAGRRLMDRLNLDRERVSFVDAWAEPYATKLGIKRTPNRPVSTLAGFDVQPMEWQLFAGLETFEVEGMRVYQFTPPAYVRFSIPDGASSFEVWQGLRPGSYEAPDRSDGVEVRWSVLSPDGEQHTVWHRHINPRDNPDERGLIHVRADLPAGKSRVLEVQVDIGAAGNGAWDWSIFGNLRIR